MIDSSLSSKKVGRRKMEKGAEKKRRGSKW